MKILTINNLIVVYAALTMFNPNMCSAGITTATVEIPCGQWIEIARAHPQKQYIFTSKGVMVMGVPQLVTWTMLEFDNIPPEFLGRRDIFDAIIVHGASVVAVCTPPPHQENHGVDMWPPNSTCTCEKGRGVEVKMDYPSYNGGDLDLRKYRFIGELTIITDEEEDAKKKVVNNTVRSRSKRKTPAILKMKVQSSVYKNGSNS